MKTKRLTHLLIVSLLLVVLLTFAACNQGEDPTDGSNIPDTIETVVGDNTSEPETETVPTVTSVKFPASKLPDYEKYATATRIKEVLGSRKTLAITTGGKKYYASGELKAGGEGIVTTGKDGTVLPILAKI